MNAWGLNNWRKSGAKLYRLVLLALLAFVPSLL